MTHTPKWRRYLRFWRVDVAADVDDELRFHLEAREAELRERGASADDARALARAEFGDVDATRRRLREIGERVGRRRDRADRWHGLRADVRDVLRGLRRERTFAAAALVTIALGIGATTAMLTVARGALVHALPFADPGRLAHAWERAAGGDAAGDPGARLRTSYADLADWRAEARTFAALEGYDGTNVTLTGRDVPVRLQGARVTGGFLAMLGARPALGRWLVPGDGGAPVVVVSHDVWRGRLDGDPAAVGRTITIDGRGTTVVGVLPPDFRDPFAGGADVWLPIDEAAARAQPRGIRVLSIVGRLRDGATHERASAELAAISARLAARHPATNAGRTAYAESLRDAIVGPTRPLVLALGLAVALVLLVAGANVASLFLARSLARGRATAVRTALGASHGRIVRQVLVESVLVASVGGAAGTALAWAGLTWLAVAAPPHVLGRLPFLRGLGIDGGVLAGTIAVTLAAGIALGLAPALHAGRVSLAALGRRDADGGGTFGSRARRALIVAELALTTGLLVGAGLMARSVVALLRVDPGFATERVVTMRVALAGPRYADGMAQQRFFEALLARARALPAVHDVGAVTNVPLVGGGVAAFEVVGAPAPEPGTGPQAMPRGVAGDYFRAMGIAIVAGRAIGPRDDASAPPAVVLSAGLAQRHFGGATAAIGRQVRFLGAPDRALTIVGVAADVRAASLDAPPPPTIYTSHLQGPENRMTLVLRTAGDPSPLVTAVRRTVRALDPELPVYGVATMAERVAGTPAVYVRRSLLLLLAGFALVATALAAVGVYGVIAYAAARRTRELGVRAALGATRRSLVALVVRQGVGLAAAGIAVGLAVSAGVARALGAQLYAVRATDALTYVAAAALLAVVTVVASLGPARRASRVNPVEALRGE